MPGYAWVLEVRPGYEAEYLKRHDEIWPDMLASLRAAGISNYNIFRHGLTLFGYFETDDLAASRAKLAVDPVNAMKNCFGSRYGNCVAGSISTFMIGPIHVAQRALTGSTASLARDAAISSVSK